MGEGVKPPVMENNTDKPDLGCRSGSLYHVVPRIKIWVVKDFGPDSLSPERSRSFLILVDVE